jgi:hypothetical protein
MAKHELAQYELRNVKIAAHLSEETVAFTATLYRNGVRIGTTKNDGQGGPNMVRYTDFVIQEVCRAEYPQFPMLPEWHGMVMTEDMAIGDLLDAHQERAYLKRITKGKLLFRYASDPTDGDSWRTIKRPFDPTSRVWLENILAEKGEALGEFLNERVS